MAESRGTDASADDWPLAAMSQHVDYLVVTDLAARITYINHAPPGFDVERMLGTPAGDWVAVEHRGRFRDAFDAVVRTGTPQTYESAGVSGRTYLNRLAPAFREGRIEGTLIIAHDVTETKNAERLLRESEERFRTLVEGAFEGIAVSVDGVIVEANQAFASMGRATREEVIGRSALDFTTPEYARVVIEQIRSGVEAPYEVVALRADGTTFPCEVLGRNSVYQGKPARITAFRDISDRKKIEEERMELEERMRESQKLENLGMLAGGVAHDFNNLLAVVLGRTGLALAALPPDSIAREHLAQVRAAAHQASELTKQMLTYAGRGKPRRRPVDLGVVVHAITELLRVTVSGAPRLVLEVDPDLPLVDADASQVQQLLINLVGNASDALAGARGTIRVRGYLVNHGTDALRDAYLNEAPGPGPRVVLAVEDDGPGIDPANVRRIFDPFFTTKFAGRGLGLSSVLGIARSHAGAIQVRSELGRGTTVSVYFPVGEAVIIAAPAPARAPVETLHGVALVADDEPLVQRMVALVLSEAGFEVVCADDGEAAVEEYRKRAGEVRIACLDLTMPRMGGRAALAELRRDRPDLPVVLLSGHADPRDGSELEPGVCFIEKPFEIETLTEAIRSLLGIGR